MTWFLQPILSESPSLASQRGHSGLDVLTSTDHLGQTHAPGIQNDDSMHSFTYSPKAINLWLNNSDEENNCAGERYCPRPDLLAETHSKVLYKR